MDSVSQELYSYYVGWFVFLLVALWLFRKFVQNPGSGARPAITVSGEFKKFQRSYVAVYLIMMAADWMQGPFVYALYQHYGFDIGDIGLLFIVGFGSSMVFGTIVGSAADKYGRKRLCLAFGILYGISCITKHFGDFRTLLFGRLLGGISTSILFSSFESWMVHQHHDANYPEDWLSLTFAVCTSGNGIVAILSGVIAGFVRDSFGPVAPFDASLVLLALGCAIILASWGENYGDSRIDVQHTLSNAWERLISDKKIAYLGFTQSFFEGAMYIFVFMWTPSLENTSDLPIYHGWIFASFMICTLIGSSLFTYLLEQGHKVERTSAYMMAAAALSLAVPAFIPIHTIRLISFFAFEVCCGMFWPSLGTMRGKYVPEEVRATVMNFFRVPLNLIVVGVLYFIADLSELTVYSACTFFLILALVCQVQLIGLTIESPDRAAKKQTASAPTADDDVELQQPLTGTA